MSPAASVMSTGHPPVNAIAIGAVIGGLLSAGFLGLMLVAEGSASSAADREIILILRDGALMGLRNCGGVAFASGVLAVLLSFAHAREARSSYNPPPPSPHTNWS